MTVWKCVSCGDELPGNRRSDKHYCGGRCRVRAHRIRKGEGKHVRPTRKHGHTALKTALATAAAATAAALAVEAFRNSQDARLAEQERKIAELQAQLRKSQTEKEELKRAKEDLRNRVEQVTRERKEKEEQLCQSRREQVTDRETITKLRFSLDRANEERSRDQQRLLAANRERDEAERAQVQLTEEYRNLFAESNRQVEVLIGHSDKLARQLAVAKDKQAAQLAKQSAFKSRLLLQSKLENAQAENRTLKQRLRSVEGELSSSTKRLAAKAQQKLLPAARDQTESIRLKGELAQAKTEIRLLRGQVEARKALPASSAQTSLAVANRSIEQLNSEIRRLNKEWLAARELAQQWERNFRLLAQRLAEVEDGMVEKRRIGRQSTQQEQTESAEPGFFRRALMAIGMFGTGAVLGAGAVSMLGRENTPKSLGRAPEQKALGPKTQRLLPPKSNS